MRVMLVRKMKVALFTSLFAILGINLVLPVPKLDGGLFLGLLVYPVYLVPLVFVYGIAASSLSDWIGSRAKKCAKILSLFLHIFFGVIFPLVFGLLFESLSLADFGLKEIFLAPIAILSMVLAGLFFIIDLFLKRRVALSETT